MTTAESPATSHSYTGIYDLSKAARYLSASWQGPPLLPVSSSKMIGWVRKGVASRDLVEVGGRELLIGFEDLISMRVIAALRAANVSWSAIREAEHWLRRATDSEQPFATETIWTGQRQVFIECR